LNSNKKEPTVIQGIDKILNWLRQNETYATFFMVGELLLAKPELLDKILDEGHEIGFHTMYHTRLDSPNYEEKFDNELKRFAEMTSKKSKGFRAPSFSLNKNTAWAINILSENNYEYDSSIVPAQTKLYGVPNAETKPYKISSKKIERNDPTANLLEFPLLTTKLFGKSIPVAGGFYIRTLPLFLIENAIKQNNNNGIPASLYVHSWEITPEFMPRIPLSILDRFITYHNLEKTLSRMDKIIKKFKFTSFNRFISNQNKN
jgi:polysaccharide deacetylase family protein (PEP-CTERM system associated)